MSLAGPLVIRALTAIGIGTMTFTGVTAGFDTLIQMAQENWAGIPVDVLSLASIAGIPQAIGLISGAFTFRIGIWAAANATKFVLGG